MQVLPHQSGRSVFGAVCAWLIPVAVLVLLLTPLRAEACSCTQSGPACQEFFQAHAVFVGRVLDIAENKLPSPTPAQMMFERRRVRLAVMEKFSGVFDGEVAVTTGMGGGDCGYGFVVGETYLVYAWAPSDGTLSVGICSRTQLLATAGADLKFLRSLQSIASLEGRIIGRVTMREGFYGKFLPNGEPDQAPFSGARVLADGVGTTLSATTREDGTYELHGPPGVYELRAEVPPDRYAQPWSPDVRIPDNRGCAQANVDIRYDGHISGLVVDAERRPASFVSLELGVLNASSEVNWTLPKTSTDANGRFEFTRVDPGRYLIGLLTTAELQTNPRQAPRLMFPGAIDAARATTIDVPPAGRVELGAPLVLPSGTHFVTLTGAVLDADTGRPLSGVHIYLRPNTKMSELVGEAVTDESGHFSIGAVEGAHYRVTAEQFGIPFRQAAAEVIAAADSLPILLRLKQPKP
jgi:5-hydroxyisourate hydrolase-like protein (transthyretin family)